MSIFKSTILAATLIVLSGCSGYGVTFQSAPATELTNCYPALVGDWRVIEGARSDPATDKNDYISITDMCSKIYSITLRQESGKQANDVDDLREGGKQSIQFAHTDGMDYAVVTPKETSFEITPEIKIPSGKIIYQLNPGKDGIILRSVDIDKIIQLVLANKMNGQIFVDRDNPEAKQTTNVYVRGDAKQIAGYLNTLELYSEDRLLLISATPEEHRLITKAIKRFEKGERKSQQ